MLLELSLPLNGTLRKAFGCFGSIPHPPNAYASMLDIFDASAAVRIPVFVKELTPHAKPMVLFSDLLEFSGRVSTVGLMNPLPDGAHHIQKGET